MSPTGTFPQDKSKRHHKLLFSEWGQYESVPVSVIEMIPQVDAEGFALFCYLLYRTNAERGKAAWPGYRRMKRDLGWGYSRISRAMNLLIDNGLLSKRKRFGATTVYTLTKPENAPVSQSSQNGSTEESEASSPPISGAQSSRNGSRTNLNDSTLEKNVAVVQQHASKQEQLIEAGVWENDAERIAPEFSEEELAAAIKACELKGPDNPGAYLVGILDRWQKFPEERSREVERMTRDPYKQLGFYDEPISGLLPHRRIRSKPTWRQDEP